MGFKGERRKSLEVSMRRTCKKDILWHVLQLHFRIRMVDDGEGAFAEMRGGGKVR